MPDSSLEGRHSRAARTGTRKKYLRSKTPLRLWKLRSGLGSPKAKPRLPACPENSETTGLRVRTAYRCPQISVRPEAEAKLSGSQGYEEATLGGVRRHRSFEEMASEIIFYEGSGLCVRVHPVESVMGCPRSWSA